MYRHLNIVQCTGLNLDILWIHWAEEWSVCQRPDPDQGPHTQPLSPTTPQAWPRLAPVNTTTVRDTTHWGAVVCSSGHVTHTFLACDVSAFCWAGRDVTFSLLPEFWALPTSQSCPTPQSMTSLPPSFPCGSEEQRVPYSLVCDHRRDCADGSDETFCTFRPCQWQSQVQCLNKQVCLSRTYSNVSELYPQ